MRNTSDGCAQFPRGRSSAMRLIGMDVGETVERTSVSQGL